jgi:uncharacterized membrane protein YdjX (TVP38/TMEM64 family)
MSCSRKRATWRRPPELPVPPSSPVKLDAGDSARAGVQGRAVRLAIFAAVLVAIAILPFVLAGEVVEAFASTALASARSSVAVALLGVALLASDVLLPVPSSFVGSALGAFLGFGAGTVIGVVGLTLGCIFGFSLGRVAGRTIAR